MSERTKRLREYSLSVQHDRDICSGSVGGSHVVGPYQRVYSREGDAQLRNKAALNGKMTRCECTTMAFTASLG